MAYMLVKGVYAVNILVHNPELQALQLTFGVSLSSTILFLLEIAAIMALLIIFAIGLLKNLRWAFFGRIALALISLLYAVYKIGIGEFYFASDIVLDLYNLFIIFFLGFMSVRKNL